MIAASEAVEIVIGAYLLQSVVLHHVIAMKAPKFFWGAFRIANSVGYS